MADLGDHGLMGVDWEERINFDRMRKERLQRAKDALDASDVDALFVFRTEDCRYLTGFRSHLHPTASLGMAACVLAKGQEPYIFSMDDDHVHARMTWLASEQIQKRANLRDISAVKDWAKRVEGLIGNLDGKKVGVDLWSPSIEKHLKEAFPKTEFVDGYVVLMKAKIIKTQDEIHCLKAATVITEAGMHAALDFLKPGVKECEVLAVAWETMTALGSEWTQCANIVCSGPYTAPYRRLTSDRIIRMGDPVIIDIGGCFNGYWGDFTRTWICGDIMPTPEQIEWHMNSYNAVWDSCEASKVGNTTLDVYKAAEPYVLDSLGHGSGTNPWELPYFSPAAYDDPLDLEEGMTFNLEPYAGKVGIGGFRLENNVVVRKEGPDVYTPYPYDERLVTDVHKLDTSTGRTR
ncbi:MAG: aminopeptidase P family protein [Nitrospinaceae bacterium]|nr:aminopeptidase P family protein [Nitrospinaceae bacterium]MBT3432314.1 aminopeptidase P family protein [Nitrospinaceae bacterium]MBT4092860.1 aminopeptidase P family protein [Nitrospinaceae bacterium]MBT5947905.1 aminopeptidase P family protein [Nitrospinaceae bacterium]MBT6394512.1 aminopeptidase P family protein [Nitrospinaceae bacterium]